MDERNCLKMDIHVGRLITIDMGDNNRNKSQNKEEK